MERATDSPYLHPALGIDKAAVVRDALQRDDVVAFAGDSWLTDGPPALLLPAGRRFATGQLARRLAAEGQAYQPFAAWTEIAGVLLER
jgi:hypothetical protein